MNGLLRSLIFETGLPVLFFLFFFLISFIRKIKKISRFFMQLMIVFIVFSFTQWSPRLLEKGLLIEGRTDTPNPDSQSAIDMRPPECIAQSKNIVVIGSGFHDPDFLYQGPYLKLQGLLELYHNPKYKLKEKIISQEMKIVFAGNGNLLSPESEMTESKIMENYFWSHVDKKSMITFTENKSQSTKENAENVGKIFKKENLDKKIILIASRWHIKRAQKTFQKQGFEVCPVATRQKFAATSHKITPIFSYHYGIETNKIIGEYLSTLKFFLQ